MPTGGSQACVASLGKLGRGASLKSKDGPWSFMGHLSD